MSVLSTLFGTATTSVEPYRTTKALTTAGFDAVNLGGGVTAWKAAGLSMVNSRGKQGSVR